MTQAIPGNTYTQSIIVENDGTIKETNIQLGYKHDGQLMYSNTSPNVYTQFDPVNEPYWYCDTTGFPALSPGHALELLTSYLVPTNIPINTVVDFWDTTAYTSPMSNWLADYSPWNNVKYFHDTIVGSFDPNFKEVSPAGTGPEGYISTSDSVLDYVIHFQNTGDYYAQKVVIIDTLSSNLDRTSMRPGYSNHDYTADMSETGILKFTFNNVSST